MFRFLKRDPKRQMQREYEALMQRARDLQRNGDIQGYAALVAEAEALAAKIDAADS